MLITITRTIINQVFKATVATESNSLEVDYMKAYGEPRVQSGGTLSFPDPTRPENETAGDVLVLGVTADTPNSRTIVEIDHTLLDLTTLRVGDSITFSGVTHEPLLNGEHTILAIDMMHHTIAINVTGIATQTPFVRNVSVGTIVINPLPAMNQVIEGYTLVGPNTVLRLTGTTDLSAVVLGYSAVISNCTLQPLLNGTHVIIGVDNTLKTITIATPVGLTAAIPQFTVADPKGDATTKPANIVWEAPTADLYVRSSMPTDFSVDGKVDPYAEQKTITWARDLRDKIVAAMTTLKAKPSPRQYPVLESTEI